VNSSLNQEPITSPPLTVSSETIFSGTSLRITSLICFLYLQVTLVPIVDLFIPRWWVQVFSFGLGTYTGQQIVS
jgi:hypothetical protein